MMLHLFCKRAQALGGAETASPYVLQRYSGLELRWKPLSPSNLIHQRQQKASTVPTLPRSPACFPAAGRHAIPVLVGVTRVPNQIIVHVRLQREQKVLFAAGPACTD